MAETNIESVFLSSHGILIIICELLDRPHLDQLCNLCNRLYFFKIASATLQLQHSSRMACRKNIISSFYFFSSPIFTFSQNARTKQNQRRRFQRYFYRYLSEIFYLPGIYGQPGPLYVCPAGPGFQRFPRPLSNQICG